MAQKRVASSGHNGVQIRKSGEVRIRVLYRGEWVYERVAVPPTPAGARQAARIREDVNRLSRLGAIDWCDHFPESSRCTTAPVVASMPLFSDVAAQWLRHRAANTSPSTWRGYEKRVKGFWLPAFGHMPIDCIRHSHVVDVVTALGWSSGKTASNALTPLRGIFELAIRDELIARNPANGIELPSSQRPPPNPLTSDEVSLVLAAFADRLPLWLSYFQTALGSGMRTSELNGLTWPDVTLRAGKVRIHSARVENVDRGKTKTARERTIKVTPLGLRGLRAQRLRTLGDGHVFVHPATGEPIRDDQPPRRAWHEALELAGVAKRRAYDTRSTFATLHLMAGTPLLEVSQILGHRNPSTTLDHYGAWMPTETPAENGLVAAFQ